MKSLKTYIIESNSNSKTLFLLTNSYKGYKVYNLFEPKKTKKFIN